MSAVKDASKRRVKLTPSNMKMVIPFQWSFETNEQGAIRVYFPFAVTVNKIRAIATKAVAASDNGTLTGANSTGNSTAGAITYTASDAIGVEKSVSPSSNNVVAADGYYQITPAKSTAGGKGFGTLEVTTN